MAEIKAGDTITFEGVDYTVLDLQASPTLSSAGQSGVTLQLRRTDYEFVTRPEQIRGEGYSDLEHETFIDNDHTQPPGEQNPTAPLPNFKPEDKSEALRTANDPTSGPRPMTQKEKDGYDASAQDEDASLKVNAKAGA